jgi:hypothetical protein
MAENTEAASLGNVVSYVNAARSLAPEIQAVRLQERSKPGLIVRIDRGCVQEHADTPHPFGLLRVRGQWPSGRHRQVLR